jgi:hypothetical protein
MEIKIIYDLKYRIKKNILGMAITDVVGVIVDVEDSILKINLYF